MQSIIQKLPNQSRLNGFTHVILIGAALVPPVITQGTAGANQVFNLPLPMNSRISNALLDLQAPFLDSSDVSNNTTKIMLGDAETANQYFTQQEINAWAGLVYDDGVIATNTSLTSATAQFVAGDVGLAVSGNGIAPGTTIASRTNATTVVLSQATTESQTGLVFRVWRPAGTAVNGLTGMTGSPNAYPNGDTLVVTLVPKAGTVLANLDTGMLALYINLQVDGDLG